MCGPPPECDICGGYPGECTCKVKEVSLTKCKDIPIKKCPYWTTTPYDEGRIKEIFPEYLHMCKYRNPKTDMCEYTKYYGLLIEEIRKLRGDE